MGSNPGRASNVCHSILLLLLLFLFILPLLLLLFILLLLTVLLLLPLLLLIILIFIINILIITRITTNFILIIFFLISFPCYPPPPANPARSLDINSVFLGLCPRYIALLDTSGNPECTEEFIASIQYDLKDQPLATDIIVYLTLAEEGKLGLQTADPNVEGFEFDSACEILEHFCTPVIRIPDSGE